MSPIPLETAADDTRRPGRTMLAVGLSVLMLVSAIAAVAMVPTRGASGAFPTSTADPPTSATTSQTGPGEGTGYSGTSLVATRSQVDASVAAVSPDATGGNDSHHARGTSTTTQVTTGATTTQATTSATITRPSVRPDQPSIKWGGRTLAVDVHPENRSIALAASESGGLFRTTDGGTNWTHLGGANLPHRLSDVEFAPSNPEVVILSAHEDSRRLKRNGRIISGGGIWRSTDGGDTWNKPPSGEPPASFPCAGNATTQSIAFEPNTTNVYVGTECGLAVSHDLGQTWEHRGVGPKAEHLEVSTVTSPIEGIVDVGTADRGHFRYDATNETWQADSLPASFMWNSPQSLAVSPTDPDVLFAVVRERDRSCGTKYNISRTLYTSDDGGQTWSMVDYPGRCDENRPPFVTTPPVATNGSFDVFVGNGDDTFRQQDCSGSEGPVCENATDAWSKISVDHADQIDIAYPADSPCPLFMANDGGVEKTKDCGATWHNVGNSSKQGGFNALQLYQVSGQIWPGHTDLYVGTQDNSIWASPDGGTTWPNAHSNEGGWLSMARYGTDHDNETITGEAEAGQFQSQPHLENARAWPNPPNISTGSSLGSKPYLVEEGVYLQWSGETGGNRTLWLTNDTGSTWREVVTVEGDPVIRGNPVVGPPEDPTMYVPYDRFGGIGLKKITNIRSPDPVNVTRVGGGIGSLAIHVRGQGTFDFRRVVEADPNDPDHVMTVDADAEAVKVSHDGGQTWETDDELTNLVTDGGRYEMIYGSERGSNASLGNRQSQVTAIAFDPDPASDRILVGTEDAGVIISNDGGDSWHRIEGSRRVSAVTSFFFDDRTGADLTRDVYASTYGRGLWRVDPTGGIGGCGRIDEPGEYHLTQDLAVNNEGVCLILNSSGITLDGNNHTLRGLGEGGTNAYPIIAFNATKRDFPFIFPPPASYSGITVRDLEVANWARPIQFVNITGSLVENVVVRDSFGVTASLAHGRGLRFLDGKHHDVVDSRLLNLSYRGIEVSQAQNVRVAGSNVSDNDAQGFLIDESDAVHIADTVIDDNHHGVLSDRSELSIVDSTVRSNDRNGLKLQGGTDTTVINNTVTGNTHGINIVGGNSEKNTVAGNRVVENRKIGIRMKDSVDSVVRNNAVRRNAWDGILLWNADGSVVRDNVVVANRDSDGLHVNDAGNVTARDNYVAGHTDDGVGIRVRRDAGDFRAIGNVIRNNTDGMFFNPSSGSGTILRNRIVDNADAGIEVFALAGINPLEVHDNAIAGNGAYGVKTGWEDKVINATGNWWGDPSGPSSPGAPLADPVTGALANGTGDAVTENGSNAGVSNVRFDPWVTEGFTYTSLSVTPRSLAAGQSAVVIAEVGNPVDMRRTVRVPLRVDGTVRAEKTRTIAAGGTTTVRFTHLFTESGAHDVTVGTAPSVDVSVRPAWRQFKATPEQTGSINTTGPTAPSAPRWTVETIGDTTVSPAVVNGTVYVGSERLFGSNMYALDARTGAIRWNVSMPEGLTSPAVYNDTVYVGTQAYLYALDARTGAERWHSSLGRFVDITSSPTVVNDTVYVGGNDDRVYALDARTGAERWNVSAEAVVQSSPAVADGTVFVGNDAGNLYAINTTTGAVRWNVSLFGKVRSSPAVSGGRVYVGSGVLDPFEEVNGSVYALNAMTGAIQWNVSTEAGVRSSPAVANGTVFIGSSDDGENLYALNATTGAERWTISPWFSGVGTSPAVVDGAVYVGFDDGVIAVDAGTGRELWRYEELPIGVTSPAVVNGTVYVGWDDEEVMALHADTVAPTIADTSLTDLTDGDGTVGDGDRIEIVANVSDDGLGVDRVGANASAFGAGIVELTDGNDDGIYNATITVDASRAAADGAYAVTVAANDTANNTATASTNDLEIARTTDTTATDTQPVSPSVPGFGPLVALLALLVVTLVVLRRR